MSINVRFNAGLGIRTLAFSKRVAPECVQKIAGKAADVVGKIVQLAIPSYEIGNYRRMADIYNLNVVRPESTGAVKDLADPTREVKPVFSDAAEQKIANWVERSDRLDIHAGNVVEEAIQWLDTPEGRQYAEETRRGVLAARETANAAEAYPLIHLCTAVHNRGAVGLSAELQNEIEQAAKNNPLRVRNIKEYVNVLVQQVNIKLDNRTKKSLIAEAAFENWKKSPEGIKMEQAFNALSTIARNALFSTTMEIDLDFYK